MSPTLDTKPDDSPHFLIVGPFDPDDETDRFDVEHPADCPASDRQDGFYVDYDCEVAMHVEHEGIDTYFIHADDPAKGWDQDRVTTGRHEIEAWSIRHPAGPWGSEEWSAGLRLVEEAS